MFDILFAAASKRELMLGGAAAAAAFPAVVSMASTELIEENMLMGF